MMREERVTVNLFFKMHEFLRVAPAGFDITSPSGKSVTVTDDKDRFTLYDACGGLYHRTDDAGQAASHLIIGGQEI